MNALERLDDLLFTPPNIEEQMRLIATYLVPETGVLRPTETAWQRVGRWLDTYGPKKGGVSGPPSGFSAYSDIADVVLHGTRHKCSCGMPMPQVEPGVWVCRTCGTTVEVTVRQAEPFRRRGFRKG